jgi:hypothetical protein
MFYFFSIVFAHHFALTFCSFYQQVRFAEQFEWFDRDATGFISERNFREGLSKLGFTMTKNDVRTLMQKYDSNFDGQISYNEFLEAFAMGRDGQGMMRRGARSLRPGGRMTQSLGDGVPTRRLRDDPERWSSGLFYDCKLYINLLSFPL